MKTMNFELKMRPEALGLERLLSNLRRRQLNLLRFSATREGDSLRLNLHLEGKDEASVLNLLRRLTDVEEVDVPAMAGASEERSFWSHFENPFG